MKIIDLLNKITNGEEVPNKFKLKDWKTDLVFYYNKKYNCYDLIGEKFKSGCYVFGYSELNDEIEILEEEKKIEKIYETFSLDFIYCNLNDTAQEEINKTINSIYDKINELIDEVNKLKEE